MIRPTRIRPIRAGLAALAVAAALPLARPALAEDGAALSRAWAAAGARDWTAAQQAAAQSGPIAADLVQWQKLRTGQGTWPEFRDFAARNPDWPSMDLIHRHGDARLRPGLPAGETLAWFGERRPTTLSAELALLAALETTGPKAAEAEAIRFWTETPLSRGELAAFLAPRADLLARHHAARTARLLDQGEWAAAELMVMPSVAAPPSRPPQRTGEPAAAMIEPAPTPALVTGPEADLARARIALQAEQSGVDNLITALPPEQRGDAGLAMDRFLWRVKAKQTDLARELLLERSTSAEALRDPVRWATFRVDHARAALRAGDWALAERLAANHFLPPERAQYSDLEWLAGYAALRAGATDRALGLFQHLETVVGSPISVARALYWQGRAMEAAGDEAGSTAAYRQAARHQSAWYGQLAAERLGLPMDPQLALQGPAVDSLPDWRGAPMREADVWQAALWLVSAGDPATAQRFLLHLAQTAPAEDIARMSRLMMELRRPWDALRLAKQAAGKGGIFPAAYYPLTGLENGELGLPPELVLAIARQESEFNHTVSSHVGARGLMQVMPGTARDMARKIGEPFDLPRLTTDAAYNARLGAAYLQGLRDRFGPSIALVAAGYNAGPGRSTRWLREFGDLRVAGGTDPVDWVEMIPFDETRNYVMRVGEALPIYRARISGKAVPLMPTWDLQGGGIIPVPLVSPLLLATSARPPARPLREAKAATLGWPDAARPDLRVALEGAEPAMTTSEVADAAAAPALSLLPATGAAPATR
ncbi:lytic transglycosylase domain-containing protein [Paracoccus sp. Z118]|uniref:lytic transglycosylase domain-containing protein n=1 Tax=Paracoccus sp. Z118 TaxID=2851017 RepID=UPI001C2C9537|nr:lytic transglycosylase domain-containing protein [Paracoccus sp. Z118]MBV0891887.1 lytic transglycosylase domain-containing protein [Paracoccus sp. Z118]